MYIVLAVLFVGVCALIRRLAREQSKRKKEAEEFLEEADHLMGLRPDMSAAEEYKKKKRSFFDKYRDEKDWSEETYEESGDGEPSASWLRQLPTQDTATLKAALVKRTVSILPLLAAIQQELQQRMALFQKDLITEKQFQRLLGVKDFLNDETIQIRQDAECLEEKYGFESLVFKAAATFHQHMVEKKMQEAQMRMRQ